MQLLLEYIVKNIVTHPDDVVIEKSEETIPNGSMSEIYTINCNSEDIGAIIGKKGQTIRSIRSIAKVKAIKDKTYVDVRVAGTPENKLEDVSEES
jgi:predicted RNA-binding protein YlqC (UPF0109 family)